MTLDCRPGNEQQAKVVNDAKTHLNILKMEDSTVRRSLFSRKLVPTPFRFQKALKLKNDGKLNQPKEHIFMPN